MAKEYILGTGNDELERLGIQHRVWADAAVEAWKRAGIGPGTRVMDVGCGPGHATFDLAQLVMDSGQVVAIDESEHFVEYLKRQSEKRGLPQIRPICGDVLNLLAAVSPGEKFDAAYCRWVLCWLKNPERVLADIAAALKPGGRLVIHDYFNWKTMTTGPRSAAVEKMVAAACANFMDGGGDLDLAARLPKLLREAGFELRHFDVHQRVARGGGVDSTLAWPLTWWRSYGPKLVKMGRLASADYEQAERDMAILENDPDQFFYCPPVFEFIAARSRRTDSAD